jgi:hypothetical protein
VAARRVSISGAFIDDAHNFRGDRSPRIDRPLRSAPLKMEMCVIAVVAARAMPVFLAGWKQDDITRTDLFDGRALALRSFAARGHKHV